MKTKIFRKTKTTVNGQRLTGNGYAMWPFSILRLPFTDTANRYCLLLLMMYSATLSAQNGITVSGLVVTAGSPTTVTFNVSWDREAMPSLWLDSAWVFVDYNDAGAMKRLPLLPGATLTATSAPGVGKVAYDDNNNQGVWVVGNARSAGSFSATVQLLTATATATGICAYASNYPPLGEYSSPTHLSFTGTPEYDIVLKHTDGSTTVAHSDGAFDVPEHYTVQSFTDRTGAPGITGCIPMTGNIDFTVTPAIAVKGYPATFTVSVVPVVPVTSAVTYSWSAPNFNPASHAGATFSATAPAAPNTYDITLTARSTGYCDLTKSKAVTVLNCINPAVATLTASASGFCAGGEGVAFGLSDTENGAKYRLYHGAMPVGAELTGSGSAATFSGTFNAAGVYTAVSVADGVYCAVSMSGARNISENSLPTAPVIPRPADVCQDAGDIVFTATGYSGTLEWISVGGGVESLLNVTFGSSVTDTKTVTARSAQTYTDAPTCYSAEVSQSATVNPLPAAPTGVNNARCGAGTLTLSASSSGAVIDWYADATGGASLHTGNSYTPDVTTSTTYYAQARIEATGCVSARTAVLATINPVPGVPTMAGGGTQCGNSRDITATAGSGGDGIRWTDNSSTVSLRSITTSGTYYAVTTSAAGCESGTASVAVTINTVPGITASAGDSRCGAGTVTLNATPSSGAVIDWYADATGGTSLYTGNSYTPDVTTSTTYYAQARIIATGCVSASRTAVLATVIPNPTITTQPAATSTCAGTTVQLSVAANNATAYQWRKNGENVTDGTGGTTTHYVTGALSASATYSVVVSNGGTCTVTSADAAVTVHTAPIAPTGLSSNVITICNGVATDMTLTATGGHAGSGAVYEWGMGSVVGSSLLSPSTTTAATRTVSTSAAVTYWVRLKGTTSCTAATGGVTAAIGVYPAVAPGAIQTASTSTTAGTAPAVTVGSETEASGGSGNLTYVWRRTGTSSATLTGTALTYPLNSDASNYSTAGTYYFNRYVKDNTCNTLAAASGTYTLGVTPGVPAGAASTQTWTFGSQTWSDRVVASPSNCTQTTNLTMSNNTTAEYKIYDGRYYYSWTCAVNAQSTLCPSPWRLPSRSDFENLVSNTDYSTLVGAWGLHGFADGSLMSAMTTQGDYWSTTEYNQARAYELYYIDGSLYVTHTRKYYAHQLRCVKD